MYLSFNLHHISLNTIAKHEAGHALLLWLLDQYLEGICVTENGGVTKRVMLNQTAMKSPSLHLLYLLAGMVMANEHEQIDDLRKHIDTPDYFAPESDSNLIAQLVRCFNTHPISVLIQHEVVLSRFRMRFRKAYNELLDTLLHNDGHLLDFRQTYEMFGKWDLEYGFDKRPKSDVVMRTLARVFNWKMPKCRWVGWDMKPLEKWEYKRPSLMELAMKVKDDISY